MSSTQLKSILSGATFAGKDGATASYDSVFTPGKVVGFYFSAHWCPPCRQFTPVLAKRYGELKAAGKDVEIIFVSSDRDTASFDEYYGSMPWLALPHGERDMKENLSNLYSVRGIPTLVFVDGGSGELITDQGRAGISSDSFVEDFPYKPKTLAEMLEGASFIRGDGSEVPVADLMKAGKTVGFYSSAHWCPPCKQFTPVLARKYKELQDAGKDMEIVFLSCDRDQASFDGYFKTMPWAAAKFEDESTRQGLMEAFGVSGIPSLVFVDGGSGRIITKAGRAAVNRADFIAAFPYDA